MEEFGPSLLPSKAAMVAVSVPKPRAASRPSVMQIAARYNVSAVKLLVVVSVAFAAAVAVKAIAS